MALLTGPQFNINNIKSCYYIKLIILECTTTPCNLILSTSFCFLSFLLHFVHSRAAVHSRERTEQVARSPSGPFQTEIQANTLGLLPCGPNFRYKTTQQCQQYRNDWHYTLCIFIHRPHPMVEPSEVCPINVEVISFMKQFGKFVS